MRRLSSVQTLITSAWNPLWSLVTASSLLLNTAALHRQVRVSGLENGSSTSGTKLSS